MVEGGGENFEDLMMGNVSEKTSESNEKFAQRVAAAQAKLKKVKKDEKKAHQFDIQLSKIIPKISEELLQFVIFMINHEVPSLTILSFLTINNQDAGKICYTEFHKFVEEKADFSVVEFQDDETTDRISWWWTFILASDHISTTLHLSEYKKNKLFIEKLSKHLSEMLKTFLSDTPQNSFNKEKLKEVLQDHKNILFS